MVSSTGTNTAEVEAALRAGRSGIAFAPDHSDRGFRRNMRGQPNSVIEDHGDTRGLLGAGDR
jgi:3-oxoacyl-[acyl-carrier-protein] synthase-1